MADDAYDYNGRDDDADDVDDSDYHYDQWKKQQEQNTMTEDQQTMAALKEQILRLQAEEKARTPVPRPFDPPLQPQPQPQPQAYQAPPTARVPVQANPFPPFAGNQPVLSGGRSAQLLRVEMKLGKSFKDPNVDQQKVYFIFHVQPENFELAKIVNFAFGQRGRLRELVRSLAGTDYSDEAFADHNSLWRLIQSLYGRWYTLICQPSPRGPYTDIVAIAPLSIGQPQPVPQPQYFQQPQPAVQNMPNPLPHLPQPVAFDDDDIPWG